MCGSKRGTSALTGEKGPGAEWQGSNYRKHPAQLKTVGEGKPASKRCGFVGTIPGLVIRCLANPTCALAISLTPCFMVKPLHQEPSLRMGRKGPQSSPTVAASPRQLRELCCGSGDGGGPGSVRVGKALYCTLIVPAGRASPCTRVTCCPISRNEEL